MLCGTVATGARWLLAPAAWQVQKEMLSVSMTYTRFQRLSAEEGMQHILLIFYIDYMFKW